MSYKAIVSAMLAEGCSAEQIAAAVIALEVSEEVEKQARRAAATERQRRSRANRKLGLSRDVTVTDCDPLSPEERSPTPPKEITPYPESPFLPSRLPADFEIDSEDRDFGLAEGLSEGEIDRSIENMRLWAAGAVGFRALRCNWHATARQFMRGDAEAKRDGKGKSPKVVAIGKKAPDMRQGASIAEANVFVKRDSPQGDAWWKYQKTLTGRDPPVDKNGGWRFPTEWPPTTARLG